MDRQYDTLMLALTNEFWKARTEEELKEIRKRHEREYYAFTEDPSYDEQYRAKRSMFEPNPPITPLESAMYLLLQDIKSAVSIAPENVKLSLQRARNAIEDGLDMMGLGNDEEQRE